MNDLSVESLLRLKNEPYVAYTESQIHQTIMEFAEDFCDLLERFYFHWKDRRGSVLLPTKQIYTTKDLKGDFRIMPCAYHFEEKIVKVVKVVGTNEEEQVVKDKICVGKALLLHPSDNYVQAIFDVCSLSSFRTAAIATLAFKYLTETRNQMVGLIGAGRIGFYTALFLHRWLGISVCVLPMATLIIRKSAALILPAINAHKFMSQMKSVF